jgi:serine/threonine protein kinase
VSEEFGRYQLIRKLATGGMAQIYLARQQGLEGFEKLLVIKRILPHLAENEEFIRMFLDEARIAARLNHPNIVQIFDLGQIDEHFFIAMEYLHGEDARRVWKQADKMGKELPVPLACRIVMDACSGLDFAHKKTNEQGESYGIVHRDVSPQNIIVTFEGGVKVVDFGIAKAVDQSSVTRSGVVKGKYSYMSPEQAAGKKVDARTDQFALGIVLYELITGERLFKRTSDIETLRAVERCQVPPPSHCNGRVPESLDPILMRALSKNPDDRYPDCIAFHLALDEWLVQNRLPSSNAQLQAFQGDIYKERLEEERKLGHPFLDEPSGAHDSGSSPKSPKPEKGPAPASASASASATSESASASVSGPTSPAKSIAPRPISTNSPKASSNSNPKPTVSLRSSSPNLGTRAPPTGGDALANFAAAVAAAADSPDATPLAPPPPVLAPVKAPSSPSMRRVPSMNSLVANSGMPEAPAHTRREIPDDDDVGGATISEVSSTTSSTSVSEQREFPGARSQNRTGLLVVIGAGGVLAAAVLIAVLVGIGHHPAGTLGDTEGLSPNSTSGSSESTAPTSKVSPLGPETRLSGSGSHQPDQVRKGHLQVTTSPSGAQVQINGASVGKSPTAVLEYPLGAELQVEATLKGYPTLRQQVTLSSAEMLSVPLTFEGESAIGSNTVSNPGSSSPKHAEVVLEGPSQLKVMFDHKARSLPLREQVSSGRHSLSVLSKSLDLDDSEELVLKPGQVFQKSYGVGKVKVVVTPVDSYADLYIAGVKRGTTPMEPFELSEGEHILVFDNPDLGKKLNRRIKVVAGQETKVAVSLKAQGSDSESP